MVWNENKTEGFVTTDHHIAYEVRKGIFNKDISYQPYWSLEDFRNIIEVNLNYFN